MGYCIEDYIEEDVNQEIQERKAKMDFEKWLRENPGGSKYDFVNELMKLDRANEDAGKLAGRC